MAKWRKHCDLYTLSLSLVSATMPHGTATCHETRLSEVFASHNNGVSSCVTHYRIFQIHHKKLRATLDQFQNFVLHMDSIYMSSLMFFSLEVQFSPNTISLTVSMTPSMSLKLEGKKKRANQPLLSMPIFQSSHQTSRVSK